MRGQSACAAGDFLASISKTASCRNRARVASVDSVIASCVRLAYASTNSSHLDRLPCTSRFGIRLVNSEPGPIVIKSAFDIASSVSGRGLAFSGTMRKRTMRKRLAVLLSGILLSAGIALGVPTAAQAANPSHMAAKPTPAASTTAPTWTHSRSVGNVTTYPVKGLSKDNYFFGIRAVDKQGRRSPVAFPRPMR